MLTAKLCCFADLCQGAERTESGSCGLCDIDADGSCHCRAVGGKQFGPGIHVVALDFETHGVHAKSLLRFIQVESAMEGIGHALKVVRIDKERTSPQFVGGAGEFTQDESAAQIASGSTELFCNEIHSVA